MPQPLTSNVNHSWEFILSPSSFSMVSFTSVCSLCTHETQKISSKSTEAFLWSFCRLWRSFWRSDVCTRGSPFCSQFGYFRYVNTLADLLLGRICSIFSCLPTLSAKKISTNTIHKREGKFSKTVSRETVGMSCWQYLAHDLKSFHLTLVRLLPHINCATQLFQTSGPSTQLC